VPGATVRAYFVAGEVVAAGRILSAGEVDSSIGQRGIEPVALPAEAAELGREALRRLGLSFSGVDFQVDEATGEHVLLDCNAAPMFANFSQMAGVDIADRLAAHLLGRAEER
jgi:glutathione synthase/RimK-type ligase-like ATP-grasp enzyme